MVSIEVREWVKQKMIPLIDEYVKINDRLSESFEYAKKDLNSDPSKKDEIINNARLELESISAQLKALSERLLIMDFPEDMSEFHPDLQTAFQLTRQGMEEMSQFFETGDFTHITYGEKIQKSGVNLIWSISARIQHKFDL